MNSQEVKDSLKKKSDDIVNEFLHLKKNAETDSAWELKYEKLIDLGKKWPGLKDEFKIDDLKVKGCQSQVWLKADLSSDGRVQFQGDSDAILVKGLVALVLSVYNNEKPKDILSFEPTFLKELGLDSGLSPSRSNGLYSMIKQVKYYAMAYSLITK
jgi:cysteine desulfuration protein SufE